MMIKKASSQRGGHLELSTSARLSYRIRRGLPRTFAKPRGCGRGSRCRNPMEPWSPLTSLSQAARGCKIDTSTEVSRGLRWGV